VPHERYDLKLPSKEKMAGFNLFATQTDRDNNALVTGLSQPTSDLELKHDPQI
jgi:hypothetical protein